MVPSVTIHYDLCKQCGRRVRIDRAINVRDITVHGETRSKSFSGYFCSPACLDTWTVGAAKMVGVPVAGYGSVPPEWNS